MASPSSKSGHDCRIFVVTVMFMLGLSGHVTSDCAHPGTGFWFMPADGKVISFTPRSVTGHSVKNSRGKVITDFSNLCYITSDGNNIYVAQDQDTGLNQNEDLFICWKLVQQSSSVMLLYDLTAEDSSGQKMKSVSTGDPSPADSVICSSDETELHPTLLYKVDSDAATDVSVASLDASKTACPDSMANKYSYVMGTDCQSTNNLDVCRDTGAARACPDKPIMFSKSGQLSCQATYTKSDTTYALMANHDTNVSDPETFRFVCFEIMYNTTFDVYASDCSNMTSSTNEQMTLSVKDSCDGTSGGQGGSDSLPAEVVFGAVAGALAVVTATGVVIIVAVKKFGLLGLQNAATVSP